MSELVSELVITAPGADGRPVPIVNNVGFTIDEGEVLALIGESGSGKTTIALALMGHVRAGCRIAGGSILIGDIDVRSLHPDERRTLRGRTVAYIAQSASASFNPGRRIMDQVIEGALIHGLMSRAEAERKAIGLFESLALSDPQHIGMRYPHQVSGGQLQRLMAAMALITDPQLVIFDEPTTALDVTTQIEVLRAFKRTIRERGATALYVSHDLAVVAQMADRIVVLNRGEIREEGTTAHILSTPGDAYTQQLLAAAKPAPQPSAARSAEHAPLLEIRGLTAGYGKREKNGLPANFVLHDIDLRIERGATLGVIGESGSGKSTCDEVTSALDTVVGAAILELLAELRRELNVAYLFISHDISTVRAICDDILVLYAGRKVEAGPRQSLLAPPFHPYTNLLISSVPELRPGWLEQARGRESLPAIGRTSPNSWVSRELCGFLDRCRLRIEGVCNVQTPTSRVSSDGKELICHRTEGDLTKLAASTTRAEEGTR